MNAPRRYELVYIVTPDAPEEQVEAIHQQVEQTVQRMGGTLEKTENWGRRKLAYTIQHNKEGVYVLEVIVGTGDLMKEIDRRLKVVDMHPIADDVDRQLVGLTMSEPGTRAAAGHPGGERIGMVVPAP